MSRGKKPHLDRPVEVSVNLPETLIAKVSLLLFDPIRGTRKHGALSALITGLLKDWVSRQGGKDSEDSACAVQDSVVSSPDIQSQGE